MNYIQVEIGGKLRGWKVNQMTLELWSKMMSGDAGNATSTYAAVYAGLVANCYVKREDPDFSFEDVCDWVDKLPEETLLLIKKTFEESESYSKVLDKLNVQLKTSGKKKVIPKKKR